MSGQPELGGLDNNPAAAIDRIDSIGSPRAVTRDTTD